MVPYIDRHRPVAVTDAGGLLCRSASWLLGHSPARPGVVWNEELLWENDWMNCLVRRTWTSSALVAATKRTCFCAQRGRSKQPISTPLRDGAGADPIVKW